MNKTMMKALGLETMKTTKLTLQDDVFLSFKTLPTTQEFWETLDIAYINEITSWRAK